MSTAEGDVDIVGEDQPAGAGADDVVGDQHYIAAAAVEGHGVADRAGHVQVVIRQHQDAAARGGDVAVLVIADIVAGGQVSGCRPRW